MDQAGSTAGGNLPCPRIRRRQRDLKPVQAAYADQFAQERIAAMLSTTPIDEAEAEQHLQAAYRVAGLEPVPVRWFDSPLAFALEHFSSEGDSVEKSVRYNVERRAWDNVWNRTAESVRSNLRGKVWENMYRSVENSVRHTVGSSLWNSVRVDVEEIEEEIEKGFVEMIINASTQAYDRAYGLLFFRLHHELFEENENDLIHLARFNEMVCGYRLGRKQAWLVRKPIRLERDAQGRLHNADGMCIQFRDGWGFYAWHGIRCSKKLFLYPERLTKEEWINERDLEIRRIMQERLGNERFVELVGGRCIDQGRHAELIEVDLGNDPERVARFARVKDTSSERVYFLRVPPAFEQADAALAWTFGLEEQDYQPTQEA